MQGEGEGFVKDDSDFTQVVPLTETGRQRLEVYLRRKTTSSLWLFSVCGAMETSACSTGRWTHGLETRREAKVSGIKIKTIGMGSGDCQREFREQTSKNRIL